MVLPSLNTARCGAAVMFHDSKLFVFGGERFPKTKQHNIRIHVRLISISILRCRLKH